MTPCLLVRISAQSPNLQEYVSAPESAVTIDEMESEVGRRPADNRLEDGVFVHS